MAEFDFLDFEIGEIEGEPSSAMADFNFLNFQIHEIEGEQPSPTPMAEIPQLAFGSRSDNQEEVHPGMPGDEPVPENIEVDVQAVGHIVRAAAAEVPGLDDPSAVVAYLMKAELQAMQVKVDEAKDIRNRLSEAQRTQDEALANLDNKIAQSDWYPCDLGRFASRAVDVDKHFLDIISWVASLRDYHDEKERLRLLIRYTPDLPQNSDARAAWTAFDVIQNEYADGFIKLLEMSGLYTLCLEECRNFGILRRSVLRLEKEDRIRTSAIAQAAGRWVEFQTLGSVYFELALSLHSDSDN